ncbi:MAG: C39 family peptidase [Ruminococcus sp.]|nr:C39 family peptidase [Ruminococcus sp.]
MNKKSYRVLSLLLALLTAFSVMTAASAAEIDEADMPVEAGAALDENSLSQVGVTPVITSIVSREDGVVISWEAIGTVSKYRVDRYYSDGRGWQEIAETKELSYVDTEVTSGNTYRYRLVGLNAAGSVMTSTATQSVTYSAPVHITSLEVVNGGVLVSWNIAADVSKVAVYRLNNGSWMRITTASGSSYLDKNVSSGVTYRYTIRGLNASGGFIDEHYDANGSSVRYLSTPSLRAENAAGGVRISWDKVEGAEQYRVFYRGSKGWTRLVTTSETSVLDDDVRSNYTYTYTVRCVSGDGETYTSYYDTAGKTVKYIAAPKLLSADASSDGIRITWEKSDGAAQYRVFFRNSSGGWSRLAATTGTSVLDKDVRAGSSYTYTVRCMDSAENYISSFYPDGIKGTFATAPVFSVSNGADGVDIKWNAVTGAEKYRVYYYGSKGWTKLTDTAETSIIDTDVESGKTYTYTVRCISADGKSFASGYLSGKKVKYYAAPKITALTNTVDGVQIKWDAVPGAEKYRVYYYGRNGWTRMTDTASTSYVDQIVSSGSVYTYTVRCVNEAGSAFMSYFKPGVKQQFIAAPEFELTRNDQSITVSWKAIGGAELYRVYSLSENVWKRIADVTGTSYEDTNALLGAVNTYTVRCLNADATAFTSAYRAGKSMKLVETPRISSVESTTKGVELSWQACAGAEKYRVYVRGDNGWTKIGETTENAFIHDAESGRDYTYTVRCVNADGTAFESEFDRTGKSIHYIASPKNIKVESAGNAVKISWTPSAGAEKYRVYYYGSKGWTRLTETTDSSVIDEDVKSGYTYRYTVRCISADGKSFTSDCEIPGVSYKFTAVPVLKAPDYTKNGVMVSWNSSKGAEKYRVYRYGSSGWEKIGETAETSFEDTTAESGTDCRYTVRCITADGTGFTSDCETPGVTIYYIAAPQLIAADTDAFSATIMWSKPAGAEKYRVYKKVSGTWKRLLDTTANTYTDNDVTLGSTYIYTVRVINNEGNRFYSGFDPESFTVTVKAGEPINQNGEFVYYDQGDYTYPYGDDTIAYSGCGPTCFAMVASTLTGRTITPVDAVTWCGNSYYVDNVGTRWDYFAAASKRFGVTMEKQLDKTQTDAVVTALRQGKYVISAQSAGRFTRSGHFIVLAGLTSDGKIIVYDPNGGNHYVGTAFALSEITASGTQYWIFDK